MCNGRLAFSSSKNDRSIGLIRVMAISLLLDECYEGIQFIDEVVE